MKKMNDKKKKMTDEEVRHPFPALYDKDSRILILGSFPSVRSREENFFYGHKRNRFWALMAGLLSWPVPVTVEEKTEFLKVNHIALWDVIGSCRIRGSSDSTIKDVVPNDLSEILSGADIQKIFCNGSVSYQYYCKYQEKRTGLAAVKLPSTSPANAAYSLERLIQEWKIICDPLKAARPGLGRSLLNWYDYNARTLPWRSDPTPYHVWISEIMLQQTRVETVIDYYHRFLLRFPQIRDLAEGPEEDLMKVWQGLGYYRRARNLKQAAVQIMENYQGIMPRDYESLLTLPGIGEYTAGAIASIAFQEKQPAVDGNVLRVYSRLLGETREITSAGVKKDIRREVLRTMPEDRPGDFNQALMDLGAGVCLAKGKPRCSQCPWDTACLAHRHEEEEKYPVKRERKERRAEEITVLRMEYGDRVILHKREEKGLLAGLFELPNLEGSLSLLKMEEVLEKWGIRDYTLSSLGRKNHIFSHVEWKMTGYRIVLKNMPEKLMKEKEWIGADPADLAGRYAIPSAFTGFIRLDQASDSGPDR